MGPVGQDDYLNKVMTESSARDFGAMFHDKGAFKIYKKAMTSVPQTHNHSYYGKSDRSSGSARRYSSGYRRGRGSQSNSRSSHSSRRYSSSKSRKISGSSSRSSE